MQIIIDRFEGEYAFVEMPNNNIISIPKILFPNAKEGDIIDITINNQAKEQRIKNIKNLMNDLFEE